MKKVLYLTNIEVPYRVRFFNALSQHCELTVLYEREKSKNRDKAWSQSEQPSYHVEYLHGIDIANENRFSFEILKYITGKYDAVIVGCCNSPVQAMAVLVMKLLGISYYLNVDGEVFLKGSGLKSLLKRLIIGGAPGYLAAGEKAAASLAPVAGNAPVFPYYFSSLTKEELLQNASQGKQFCRNDTVLVVGQYFDYKGMDVALEAAKMDPSVSYKFVGMGNRTGLFRQTYHTEELSNVELIPFLPKEELAHLYKTCAMLVLPSRQECWGLVVNEAASFGMPVVSTWGSGAAVEFLADTYPQYLAQPGDACDLYNCIRRLNQSSDCCNYGNFLRKKNETYSIDASVEAHKAALMLD